MTLQGCPLNKCNTHGRGLNVTCGYSDFFNNSKEMQIALYYSYTLQNNKVNHIEMRIIYSKTLSRNSTFTLERTQAKTSH